MAAKVPVREAMRGDCGCKGRGGGARLGSELSHLFLVSLDGMTRRKYGIAWRREVYIGISARAWSNDAEC